MSLSHGTIKTSLKTPFQLQFDFFFWRYNYVRKKSLLKHSIRTLRKSLSNWNMWLLMIKSPLVFPKQRAHWSQRKINEVIGTYAFQDPVILFLNWLTAACSFKDGFVSEKVWSSFKFYSFALMGTIHQLHRYHRWLFHSAHLKWGFTPHFS